MGPMRLIHGWGFAYGIYPWGSALVMGTFDGKTFFGWVVDFFLGETGGDEKASGHGQQGRSLDDVCFQTVPFCFIFYIT
jgi:hypothetical protein